MDYAVFLRGVNVGGVKVESAKLRLVLQSLGYEAVTTYLASGNVTLRAGVSASELKQAVEQALSEAFTYQAKVLVYERSELAAIVSAYPFEADPDHHRYAVLCDSERTAEVIAAGAVAEERVKATGTVVYWKCPKGSTLATPFSKVLARKEFGQLTTNRNLNTLEKMI